MSDYDSDLIDAGPAGNEGGGSGDTTGIGCLISLCFMFALYLFFRLYWADLLF